MSANKQAPLVGADGMVLMEYVGGNVGEQTWDCQNPYARYVFSAKSRVKYVDARHADQMLAFYAGSKSLFRLVKTPPAADLTIEPAEAREINTPAPIAMATPPAEPTLEPVDVIDPGTMSVKDLRKRVRAGEFSLAELRAMLKLEKASDTPRGTAVDDLEKAIANVS